MQKKFFPVNVLIIIFCLMVCVSAKAQKGLPIGTWRVHLNYSKSQWVAVGGNKVYCAGKEGLFSYDKSDESVQRITRISGLSDFEISGIRYNHTVGVLMIAYANSNIDLIFANGNIMNMSDIKRANILGSKNINGIYFYGKYAYLSCDFGIVVIDLAKTEVKDTYYIVPSGTTLQIFGTAINNNDIYAATSKGLYKASLNDPNLSYYAAWSRDNTLNDSLGKFSSVTSFSNKIWITNSDTTHVATVNDDDNILFNDGSGNGWQYAFPGVHSTIKNIDSDGHFLYVVNGYSVSGYDDTLGRKYFVSTTSDPDTNVKLQPNAGISDLSDHETFWVADGNYGLVKIHLEPWTNITAKIFPNGPGSSNVFDMKAGSTDVWVASGSYLGTLAPQYFFDGVFRFSDDSWTTYNSDSMRIINDPVAVAVDPDNSKHAFVSSWGWGVCELNENGFVKLYNLTNSSLQLAQSTTAIRAGGLGFDHNNNLWVVNSNANNLLSERFTDGTWKSYNLPGIGGAACTKLIVDANNNKWVIRPNEGLAVFNENDPNNNSDNSFVKITTAEGNGKLPSLNVLSIIEDRDQEIWIGTDQGVAVFYSPGSVFTGGSYDCQQILIQQDGHNQYLLATEAVTAIAVDGANRKWFGTANGGVFLMSADGTQQISHFNTSNSPLLSNTLISIAINQETGEIFFGTDKGIISYKGTSTEGKDDFSGILVYPNPVTHDYNGLIAIKGLVENAKVKITDIAGNIVYETFANGGQAVWDGKNFNGRRVQSGVYLVFCSNDDGTKTIVSKFLMLN